MSFANVAALPSMTPHEADAQPYGIIKVDENGVIQLYNRWESNMAGVSPDRAVGKNFFTQIAPCTNNRLVYGRFKSGAASGNLDVEFNYTFTYKMRPTNVRIHLYHHAGTGTNWVLVSKK